MLLLVLWRIVLEGIIDGGQVISCGIDDLKDRAVGGANDLRQRTRVFLGAGLAQPRKGLRRSPHVVDQTQKPERLERPGAFPGEIPICRKAVGVVIDSVKARARYRWITSKTAFG